MKRLGNLWPDVTNPDNGLRAVVEGTRFKRYQREVQRLLYPEQAVAEDPTLYHRIDPAKGRLYAEKLCGELAAGTWKHRPPRHKRQFCRNRASSGGKWRDLYIPTLDDHIIAHMVMDASMDAFLRGMHPHSCGSVPGRGISHVNRCVKKWMKHDKELRYFVKLDIRKFFDTIDRDRLMGVLESKIKDKAVLNVFRQIIDSAPTACPEGYYTSPWLANLYIEELDWFAEQQLYKVRRGKRIKYIRHYLRYVDDILLLGTSRKDLEKAVRAIAKWLRDNRGLEIKPTWEIKAIGVHETVGGEWRLKPGTYWCDICGYKFCKDATILRDGIYLATRRLAKQMGKQKTYTVHQCASLNSRIGWASHCDSKSFVRLEIEPYVNLEATRRIISNVDKERKCRSDKTPGRGGQPGTSDRPAELPADPGG